MIFYSAHPLKKTNFFKVAKVNACDILLTAAKHITALSVNRLACSQPFCAILCNSLHYRPCYGKTRVWGWYNVYKSAGAPRVNWREQKKIIFICLTRLYNKMIKLSDWETFKKKLLSVKPWCPTEDYSLMAQNIYNFKVGVGIQSKVARSKYTHW